MEKEDKGIIVLNPIQRKWLGLFSNEQMLAAGIGAGAAIELTSMAGNFSYPWNLAVYAANLPVLGGIVYLAHTHEKLIENVHLAEHKVQKLAGNMKFRKYVDPVKKLNTLLQVREIREGGLIRFSDDEWGYIIPCMTGDTHDDAREVRTELIRKLHDSFPANVSVHISAKSQIMTMGAVEDMITRQCPSKKSKKEMELITSMLEKSRDSPKPVEWFTTVGLFIQCKEDEVESFVDLLQGVLNALQDAEILAFPLTNPADVKAFYANDFSSVRVPVEGRLPLLLDNDSMYSNIANHVLPNLIEFYDRYFVIEEVEYGTCMVCGLPQGGVSGYPRDLNFSFIEKLYALSASEKQVIKLDLVYLPMEKVAALENVENYTDAIDVNITTATRKNQEAQADKFKHERLKWKNKMDSLADGDIGEFYGVFIVTILTSDKKALDAAIRRVEGLLNGNRISHAIIAGRMREVYSWTKMVPLRHKKFLKKITPKLFSDSLTQITPLISGLHPRCSAEGTLYGVTIKGKEIIIDESKLAAKHMLICGSTGSGKTTAELTIGLRKYVQGNDVCYITVKSDEGTDFLNVARNLEVDGQVIELGPKTNPGETVYNVNILDILRPDTDFNPEIVFYAHISTLKNFFGVLFENSYGQSDNMPAYLEDSLVRLYGYRPDFYVHAR